MMASTFILFIYTLSSEDPANPYSVETISSLFDQNLITSNPGLIQSLAQPFLPGLRA